MVQYNLSDIFHIIIKSSTLKFLFQYITHSTLNQFINITKDTIKHYKTKKNQNPLIQND